MFNPWMSAIGTVGAEARLPALVNFTPTPTLHPQSLQFAAQAGEEVSEERGKFALTRMPTNAIQITEHPRLL